MRMTKEKFLVRAISELIRKAETSLPKDVEYKLKEAYKKEKDKLAKIQLEQILQNIKFARKESLPICQDTGLLTFYVKIGEKSNFKIFEIERAIKIATEIATMEIPLRYNLVDAITRKQKNSNVGFGEPEINYEFFQKKRTIEIALMAKGAGSENMVSYANLSTNSGKDEIKKFVLQKVKEAGGKPCPPIILGIGIGGSSEKAMKLAKIALMRKLDDRNKDKKIAKFEEEILREVNKLGIGVMGLGGKTTCLSVNIEKADTHIASLPVAISFSCFSTRRAAIRIFKNNIKFIY